MAIHTAPPPQADSSLPNVRWQSAWGMERILTLVTFAIFLAYGTYRAFENSLYDTLRVAEVSPSVFRDGVVPHYLSPFYSPPIQDWFGSRLPISAALFLLIFPGSFRATCYFCRRTYYRALFGTPPACAAKEVMRRSRYTGEREFPLVIQNLHRYTLYAIMVFVVFHWIHLFQAFRFGNHFGIGLGTLVFGLDTVLLSLYVGSCHSFRHLVGGILDRFSTSQTRYSLWRTVSHLNEKHGLFFWLSLISVGLADAYVRLVCSGAIQDFHIVF